jgi:hypothetical protein
LKKIPTKSLLTPIAVIGIAAFAGIGIFHANGTQVVPLQNTKGLTAAKMASKHSGAPPMAELESGPTETMEAQSRRQLRESRNKGFYAEIKDPGKEVEGEAETLTLSFLNISGELEALPVASSNAVLIGTVKDAKAFVSQDHTYVYSDFTIAIDTIIKPDSGRALTLNEQIVASRTGGSVRFPSGHITHFMIHGQGLPEVGSRYVLFLWKPHPQINEYQIDRAYQIKNGRIQSLDDGKPFSGFDDMDVLAFLGQLETAVANQVPKGGQ